MYLTELITGLAGASLIGRDVRISGLAYDSRLVAPGDLFIAIPGLTTDGHHFLDSAVENGAAAAVVEAGRDDLKIPQVLVGDSRATLPVLADRFFAHPTGSLKLVGITGTNGKTTTSFLVESVFKAAGWRSGLIGTIECHIGRRKTPVVRTTPEASDLQKTFRDMVDVGVEAAVMEVSSHALDLHRVDCCDFDVAVFTNLSRDHLDYHPSIDAYFEAKSRLFTGCRAVVNTDDAYGRRLAGIIGNECVAYGLSGSTEITAKEIILNPKDSRFRLVTPEGACDVNLRLPGAFNVYNALAAAGSSYVLGVPLERIKEGLEALEGVPGRFEMIFEGQESAVVVDYAHTPDGLEKLLSTARELAEKRLICVFGCGGDRDKTKRGIMGTIAGTLADYTIITSDNPRSEEPLAIIGEIEAGMREVADAKYEIVPDRREAIKKAISLANAGDFVVIAGKGHETGQIFAGGLVLPFDDRKVAREVIKELAACSR